MKDYSHILHQLDTAKACVLLLESQDEPSFRLKLAATYADCLIELAEPHFTDEMISMLKSRENNEYMIGDFEVKPGPMGAVELAEKIFNQQ